jgi:hypothetical protein
MTRRTDVRRATPKWPCPRCGSDDGWDVRRPLIPTSPPIWAVFCRRCNGLFTAHWVDGCWMGRWWEAGRIPGESFAEFVADRAASLRGEAYGD